MSFTHLTNSGTIIFEQSFTWTVGRFNFAYVCLVWLVSLCQFTIRVRKYMQKWCYKTNGKRVIWVRECTFMTFKQKVSWVRVLLFLNNISIVHFCRWWGSRGGKEKLVFFVDFINGWSLIYVIEWILLLFRVLEIIIQVIQRYITNSCLVFNQLNRMNLQSKYPKK